MPRHLSYWLVPADQPLVFFQHLIETLAHAQQAPVFAPHLTIYSGESPAAESPLSIIPRAMSGVNEIRLQVGGISYSDQFTKTLFVQFHQSELLTRITENMRRLSAFPSAYELNPHLSLLYKHMAMDEKQSLACSLQLPMSEVSFDAVWGVESEGSTSEAKDVMGWRVVCRESLRVDGDAG